MLLIAEQIDQIECISEEKDGKKNLYIQGVFMESGIQNKNGRIYSRNIMEKAMNTYVDNYVKQRRAYGELNHPSGPTINLDRVSHMIESLQMNPKGQVIGKARIVDTPMGNIARGLMECGANLGVSTRGLGSIKENQSGIMEVQDDFRLVTAADIVADPSAPNAFVKGIMENVDWFYDEKRGWVAEEIKAQVHRQPKRINEENALRYFEGFLKSL